MSKLFSYVLDILFPKKCNSCTKLISKENKYYLCSSCLNKVKFIDENHCEKCGKELIVGYSDVCADCRRLKHYFDKAVSIVQYEGIIKKMLINYKFYKRKEIVNTLVHLINDKINVFENIELVIGVPTHRRRLNERGFNQAEELAKILAKRIGVDFDNKSLVKKRNTKSQSTLSRDKRLHNLKGAFKIINKITIYDKVILLIDDIYTTGTTVSECARALKIGGAKKVFVLTVASGEGY